MNQRLDHGAEVSNVIIETKQILCKGLMLFYIVISTGSKLTRRLVKLVNSLLRIS